MTKRPLRWIVEALLAVVGVLGAHDLATAPEAWLDILAERRWIAVVLTFGGGAGVTLAIQDIWRSRLPHRSAAWLASQPIDWLANRLWGARQFFLGTVQSGHFRAYHPSGPDEEEPPDPVCITTRAGVRFKRPWRSTPPDGADEFWVATTFVTVGVDGVLSVLPPSKMQVWGAVYGSRSHQLHTDRRSTDTYMRYRRLSDGNLSPQVPLGRAPVQGWKELCSFHAPGDSDERRDEERFEAIDLDGVSELSITFKYREAGKHLGSVPGATFSRVADLQPVPASEEDPVRERMLYCQLAEGGSSAVIGMPAYAGPARPPVIKCGLTFRQSSDSTKNSVTDALLFYYPGGLLRPDGRISVDWR